MLKTAYFRPFTSEIANDPALDAGDYVRLRGGSIDTSRGYATGIITHSTWRYQGKQDIVNVGATPVLSQLEDGTAESAAVMLLSSEVDESEESGDISGEEVVYTQPKPQSGKYAAGVDSLNGVGMKSPLDSTSEIFNCYEGDDKNDAGTSGQKNYGTVRGLHNVSRGYTSEVGGNRNTESGLCNFVYGAQQKVENCSGTSVFNACNELKNVSGGFVSGSDNVIKKKMAL